MRVDDDTYHGMLAAYIKAGEDLVFRTRIVCTVLNEYIATSYGPADHVAKAAPFVDLQQPHAQILQDHASMKLTAASQLPANPRVLAKESAYQLCTG